MGPRIFPCSVLLLLFLGIRELLGRESDNYLEEKRKCKKHRMRLKQGRVETTAEQNKINLNRILVRLGSI